MVARDMPIRSTPVSPIRVRPARVRDAPAIVCSQVRMAWETEGCALDPPTVVRGVRAVLDDPGKGAYWVAERSGRFCGCLLITREWSEWRNGWIWWIQSLYVVPSARRRGVYRALWRRVRDRARRACDVYALRLYVDRRNTTAQRVYEALGMDGDHYRLYEWVRRRPGPKASKGADR
jgi:GNAT superfamily N-acetyltransferase